MHDVRVIDGDGHFIEPLSLWTDYVPVAMQDRIRVVHDVCGNADHLLIGDVTRSFLLPEGAQFGMGDYLTPGGLQPGPPRKRRFEDATPGGWDMAERLTMHDRDGIAGAVLFATRGLQIGSVTDPDVAVAAARAINDWAADYAGGAPGEVYVTATLPDHFPDLAAAELRRCVEHHGFVAGAIRPNPTVDGRELDHPSYDILWQTAQELEVPICCHNLMDFCRDQLGQSRMRNFVTEHSAVHPFEMMAAFASLYQGGAFDRFPGLRVGFMEAACGWVPFWLERLHEHWEKFGWLAGLARDPREIFRERCAVGCEGDEEMVPYVQERFGLGSVIWASDFPHFDTEPPFTAAITARTDLTDAQLTAVTRDAAVAFYGLNLDRVLDANRRRRAAQPVPTSA